MACWPWLLSISLLGMGAAQAACPSLPDRPSVRWDESALPGLTFCKAFAVGGDEELLSVTVGESTPFRPRKELFTGSAIINGQRVSWYRGEDGFDPALHLREAVIRLARKRVAHVVVRARDEDTLRERMRMVEHLRFVDP